LGLLLILGVLFAVVWFGCGVDFVVYLCFCFCLGFRLVVVFFLLVFSDLVCGCGLWLGICLLCGILVFVVIC